MKHTFSGAYGIVLRLDPQTTDVAKSLARKFTGNDISLADTPSHITLYHTNFINVPLGVVEQTLTHIADKASGVSLVFNEIAPYENIFFFWNIRASCAGRASLQEMHEEALQLKKYFNSGGVQQTDREGLKLSGASEYCVRTTGYQFCHELFTPHITLAVCRQGDTLVDLTSFLHNATISSVDFVKVGEWGTIKEIILSLKVPG